MRPTAFAAGVLAAGFTVLAVQQGLSARDAREDAKAMVLPGGALSPGSDPSRYHDLVGRADTATRNAYLGAGAAAALAATASILGWVSRERPPEPVLALRF
jgi:hypothetical protein